MACHLLLNKKHAYKSGHWLGQLDYQTEIHIYLIDAAHFYFSNVCNFVKC